MLIFTQQPNKVTMLGVTFFSNVCYDKDRE